MKAYRTEIDVRIPPNVVDALESMRARRATGHVELEIVDGVVVSGMMRSRVPNVAKVDDSRPPVRK